MTDLEKRKMLAEFKEPDRTWFEGLDSLSGDPQVMCKGDDERIIYALPMESEHAAACSLLPRLLKHIVTTALVWTDGYYKAHKLWMDLWIDSNGLQKHEVVCKLITDAVLEVTRD